MMYFVVSRTPLPLRTEPKGGLLDPNEICGRWISNEIQEADMSTKPFKTTQLLDAPFFNSKKLN